MKSNIFIPEKINVGYQERSSTYTGKLAYVIYFDEKGVLRKETSWNGWRKEELGNDIYSNVPTEGFVLNKKVGDYVSHWNHRQAYVRVYDSRGFEFEITIENLLYILENCSSIKGKGLEGEFIYSWDGKELVLLPVDSPDYKEITSYNNKLHNRVKLKGKDLKLGAAYLTKDNNELVYLGRYDEWDYENVYEEIRTDWGSTTRWTGEKRWFTKKKAYFFANSITSSITTVQSLSSTIIAINSEECVDNYAELIDKLERNSKYSPIDDSKDEYVDYTFEEFEYKAKNSWWSIDFYVDGKPKRIYFNKRQDYTSGLYEEIEEQYEEDLGWKKVVRTRNKKQRFESLQDVFEMYKPKYLNKYLRNGKLYSEGK